LHQLSPDSRKPAIWFYELFGCSVPKSTWTKLLFSSKCIQILDYGQLVQNHIWEENDVTRHHTLHAGKCLTFAFLGTYLGVFQLQCGYVQIFYIQISMDIKRSKALLLLKRWLTLQRCNVGPKAATVCGPRCPSEFGCSWKWVPPKLAIIDYKQLIVTNRLV